jgi:putative ABC transport system permease protein
MTSRLVHWRYLRDEAAHRWRRTILTVSGIALAVALVVLVDILGRAFAEVATLPFRSLSADLIVQRSATQAALPRQMGLMLPYSAQPIGGNELRRLAAEAGVEQASGFVLLWNFGTGRFFSVSGIPFDTGAPPLGPARAREWLIKGRLPAPGTAELLVERHYGAFYRLDPGAAVELAGQPYTVVGVVDIQQGSQIAASNFYVDIDRARALVDLPPDAVNQVFLKVARIDRTEDVKARIAAWMPQASVLSPDTLLKLFGGVSQVIGRFRSVALPGAALAALALTVMLLYGTIVERRKEAGILLTLGWTPGQVRRQIAAESAIQGALGGLLALALVLAGMALLADVTFVLPASLPGEHPADFAAGGFRAAPQAVALPVSGTPWDWLLPPLAAAAGCGLLGWLLSARLMAGSVWVAVKES